jgi:hypothetical protein
MEPIFRDRNDVSAALQEIVLGAQMGATEVTTATGIPVLILPDPQTGLAYFELHGIMATSRNAEYELHTQGAQTIDENRLQGAQTSEETRVQGAQVIDQSSLQGAQTNEETRIQGQQTIGETRSQGQQIDNQHTYRAPTNEHRTVSGAVTTTDQNDGGTDTQETEYHYSLVLPNLTTG